MLTGFVYIAWSSTGSALAASRPALTFFCVQLALAVAVRADWLSLPPIVGWTTSYVALGVGALFAILELAIRHSEDLEDHVVGLGLDQLSGALSSFTLTVLLAAAGAPEAEMRAELAAATAGQDGRQAMFIEGVRRAGEVEPTAPNHGLTAAPNHGLTAPPDDTPAAAQQQTQSQPWYLVLAALAIGTAVNQALVRARGAVVSLLGDLSLYRWFAWVESGGVVGVAALAAVLPILAFALILALGAALAAGGLGLRGVALAADRAARRPCPVCADAVRVEATRCPKCKADIPATVRLEAGWAGRVRRAVQLG
jgi:hypothetical protein